MTRSVLLICGLLAILVASLVLTSNAVHSIRETQRAIAAREQTSATLRAEIAAREQRLLASETAHAELQAEIAKLPAEQKAIATTDTTAANHKTDTAPTNKPRVSGRMLIANDPERAARFFAASRESMEARHGALFKALGWSSEQIEKFKDMKAQTEQAMRDLNATADAKGLGRRDRVFLALWQADAEKRMKIEAETLGTPEALEKYNEFNRVEVARNLAMDLAVRAVYAEAPLTSAQVERVTEILAANSQRFSNGRVMPDTVNWEPAYAAAQSTLSPAQIAALQEIRQQQELQRQVGAVLGPLLGRKPLETIQDAIREAGPLPKVPGS